MKIYLCTIALFVSLTLVNCEFPPEYIEIFDDCAEEIGLTQETYQGMLDHDDHKGNCHHACMMTKFGSMADGKVVTEMAIQVAEKLLSQAMPDPVKAIMAECTSKANEQKEKCEVAGAFKKCITDKYNGQ